MLDAAGLTGRMWATWTRVATVINTGLLQEEQLKRLDIVMNGIRTIEETQWTDEQLDAGELQDLVNQIVETIVVSTWPVHYL
jgi:hypothetical protein